MDFSSFIKKLEDKKIEYRENEVMSGHTTFKIGGTADAFVLPKDKEELKFTLNNAKNFGVPIFILGKGSNLLVSDKGIEGAVVSLSMLDEIKSKDNIITCGAGANLSAVCAVALKNGLSGLEFAYGIPGSVGGAVYMNAGAYGGEMSSVVTGAYCLDKDKNEIYIEKKDMDLSYRNSIFKNNGFVITEVVLELVKGNETEIKDKMNDLIKRRKEKQPLEFPSAGSTFKRPAGNFAGTLIEKNGLKGTKIGGAMVSKKHAGFIINFDNATSKDVEELIEKVKDTVMKNDGVLLEPEVITVGRR